MNTSVFLEGAFFLSGTQGTMRCFVNAVIQAAQVCSYDVYLFVEGGVDSSSYPVWRQIADYHEVDLLSDHEALPAMERAIVFSSSLGGFSIFDSGISRFVAVNPDGDTRETLYRGRYLSGACSRIEICGAAVEVYCAFWAPCHQLFVYLAPLDQAVPSEFARELLRRLNPLIVLGS